VFFFGNIKFNYSKNFPFNIAENAVIDIPILNMHIVFVSREYIGSQRAGGIATYVSEVAEEIAMRGHEVTVICASDDTRIEEDLIINQVNYIKLRGGDFVLSELEANALFIKKFRFFYRFISYRWKIRKKIKNLKNVSIIEVPEYGAEGLFLFNLNIPIVVRLHGPSLHNRFKQNISHISYKNFYKYWIGLLEFRIVKRAKYVTACSRSHAKLFTKYLNINESSIEIIYNPIKISSQLKGNHYNQKKDKIKIFTAGTVTKEKGIENLISACKIVREAGYNIDLEIAGKMGGYGCFLRQYIKNQNLQWCAFQGLLPKSEVMKFYSTADICVFVSFGEPFGLVCGEAMSSGALVIGASDGGMKEIIDDGKSGFLVEPGRPELLAKKIVQILNLSASQKSMISQNAQKKINNFFSFEVIIPQMICYYNNIIPKTHIR
jgi:glycosyltransferase involved in cell wall biosynthesis